MRPFFIFFYFIYFLLLLTDCRQPDYFIQKNKPYAAFKYAENKLGKKNIKTKYLKALEYGYNVANERDIKLIGSLKEQNDLINWKKIHYLNRSLLIRQEKIEPYLPLVSEDGYRPIIKLNPVRKWEEESFWKVTDLYLKEIRYNLSLAQNGKKLKARKAYDLIQQLVNEHGYFDQEIIALEDSTYLLGKSYFLLNYDNASSFWCGLEILDWMYGYDYFFKKDNWREFHLFPQPSIKYDFTVNIRLEEGYVSGENISSVCETFEKEIEVGKREIKDTSGKITYEPIFEKISATVTTFIMNKRANIDAEIILISNKNQEVVFRKTICGTDIFCDNYCRINGDCRATSTSCWLLIPSFPTDWEMFRNCSAGLKNQIMWSLRKIDVPE